jgi:hypothetical protein
MVRHLNALDDRNAENRTSPMSVGFRPSTEISPTDAIDPLTAVLLFWERSVAVPKADVACV